jgi:tetratricopeptide (TPR) repeat protein
MADYLTHLDKDPFAVFDLPTDASPAAIRARYVELCDKYAPRRFEAPQLRAVSEKADELLRAVILAFRELDDERRRSELLATRGDRAPRRGHVYPESHFAGGAEELADSYCQRGHELMDTGNFGAASDLFSLALASDPEQSAYAVELAYAHFREPDGDAAQSLSELEKVLSRDPDCVQALLYAAEMAHALGQLERAERYFLRGCELWASQWSGAPPLSTDSSPEAPQPERAEPGSREGAGRS